MPEHIRDFTARITTLKALGVREDIYDDLEIQPFIPSETDQATFDLIEAFLADDRDLKNLSSAGAIPWHGKENEIDIIMISRDEAREIFFQDRALGMHVVSTPELDVFDEGTSESCRFRIAVVWEPAEIMNTLRADYPDDEIREDPYLISDYTKGWMITVFHELHHAILFAENSSFHAPEAARDLAEEQGHDLFDLSSGYGIRSLVIDGEEWMLDDCDEAHDDMEAYVEARGKAMMDRFLMGSFDVEKFIKDHGIALDEDEVTNAL